VIARIVAKRLAFANKKRPTSWSIDANLKISSIKLRKWSC